MEEVIRSKLSNVRSHTRLCDLTLIVENQKLSCHRDLVTSYCEFFKGENSAALDISHLPGVSFDLVSALINSLYGEAFIITRENCSSILGLAEQFKYKDLVKRCTNLLTSEGIFSDEFSVDVSTLVHRVQKHSRKKQTIVYGSVRLKFSRFVMILLFDYFATSWSDPRRKQSTKSTFTENFRFSTEEFSRFWACVGKDWSVIPPEDFYCFFHLANYLVFLN
ncbi:hypothetical protein RCL1_008158 [Eukaryota sp. TZLM3-RCL]